MSKSVLGFAFEKCIYVYSYIEFEIIIGKSDDESTHRLFDRS